MELIKSTDSIYDDMWDIYFVNHKMVTFTDVADLKRYLNGEKSETHGFMEYEKVPDHVVHIERYNINYES